MQTYLILLIYLVLIMIVGYFINLLTARMTGGWIYRILVAPGVIIHELSHALGCLITGAHIQSINPFKRDGGELKHTGSPIPVIGNVVISLMPIATGIAILYFLPNLFSEVAPPQVNIPETNNFKFIILNFYSIFNDQIFKNFSTLNLPTGQAGSQFSILSWQFWAFIYLVFNLVATMAPSKQDIKVIWWDLLVIAGIFYLLTVFGAVLNITTFLPLLVLSLIYSIIVLAIVAIIYLVLKII